MAPHPMPAGLDLRRLSQPERAGSEVPLFRRTSRKRPLRALRPSAEGIEERQLLSGYSPSAVEQDYLELLDDARFDPSAYGVSLGVDLSSVAPSQPLATSTLLVQSARLHSQDMIAQNYFAHNSPQGVGPGARIAATGFSATGWAESIETNTNPSTSGGAFSASYGAWDAGYSLGDLIVDQGVPSLGHRVMLLDIGGLDHAMQQVGIGIATQDSTSGGFPYRQSDTTIDLAATPTVGPFLTGVVFNDTAGDGEYQPGEGLAGVTISVAGVGSTTTLDAGGYSMALAPGTYTVTASGGGLSSPIARAVVVGSDNVRLNFVPDPDGATLVADSTGAIGATIGSFTAMAAGDTASSYSARIDWGDGHTSFGVLVPGANGTFAVQGADTYAGTGVYAIRVLVTHLADGHTMALNAAAVVDEPGYNPTPPGSSGSGSGSTGTGSSANGSSGSSPIATGTTTEKEKGQVHHKARHPQAKKHPHIVSHPRAHRHLVARPGQSAKWALALPLGS